jgi:hypothetical protein
MFKLCERVRGKDSSNRIIFAGSNEELIINIIIQKKETRDG